MQGEKSQKSPLLINYTTARSKSQAKASLTSKHKKRNKPPTRAQASINRTKPDTKAKKQTV